MIDVCIVGETDLNALPFLHKEKVNIVFMSLDNPDELIINVKYFIKSARDVYYLICYRELDKIHNNVCELLNNNIPWGKIIPLFDSTCELHNMILKDYIDIEGISEEICFQRSTVNRMVNIYIWGTGKGAEELNEFLRKEKCCIKGYIDNNSQIQGSLYKGKEILSIMEIGEYDYLLVSIKRDEVINQIKSQIIENNIPNEKIVFFYDYKSVDNFEVYDTFIKTDEWKDYLIKRELFTLEHKLEIFLRNQKYEIYDEICKGLIKLPRIATIDDTLDMIISHRCSLARFGDGEFGIIENKQMHKFQKVDEELSEKLQEVFNSHEPQMLIAIADNYGSLENMTTTGADSIRNFLSPEERKNHMSLIDCERIYHNAYISRPYMYFKDKSQARKRFMKLKRIWDKKDVVVIEGEETRMGVGNDLFENARSIRRIIGPKTNAYDRYRDILYSAQQIEKEALFLIALGPTATVLAYDLFLMGYQALDIGHIDIEYEWFLRDAQYPMRICAKYVNEATGGENTEMVSDPVYVNQIIARVV